MRTDESRHHNAPAQIENFFVVSRPQSGSTIKNGSVVYTNIALLDGRGIECDTFSILQ
jgi:hypothetical protein